MHCTHQNTFARFNQIHLRTLHQALLQAMSTVIWMHNCGIHVDYPQQLFLGKANGIAIIKRRKLGLQRIKCTHDPFVIGCNP